MSIFYLYFLKKLFNTFVMEVKKYDVLILGAGAAGLMAAIEAGKRGRTVCVLEHNDKVGKKIRISGGGRCNFTNIYSSDKNFISSNPHFCKSAFARFNSWDMISRIADSDIPYHEKKDGQQFCDKSAQDIIDYLLAESKRCNVVILKEKTVKNLVKKDHIFITTTETFSLESESFIVASGALSIPKIGATDIGYKIAKQFKHEIVKTKPGLVPLVLSEADMKLLEDLKGISIDCLVSYKDHSFRENILFTHKGLSGPAILQISSYWLEGTDIVINLLPDINIATMIDSLRKDSAKRSFKSVLSELLPNRFVSYWLKRHFLPDRIGDLSKKDILMISDNIHEWRVKPIGTEGYLKAEVTIGGVDTDGLSSKTMESKKVKGLFFIGEVVDVTGHLGGHNFQWAWSSGFVAGQFA
jgi:predicted Rossmann fold flavoprotein